MGSATMLFYGSMGFALACFSNGVRKLPVMRRPWEHVLYFGLGTCLGSGVEQFKANNLAQLEEVKANRAEMLAAREARIAAKKANALEASS